ncbi:hypothetical protein [Actinotalea fermentans]|uniref:Uncharacterized protein n=1 Tax=Actinotalea fermentans TaxID=43671 RepID=A0A511YY32_9CELL|nr:hypothetical protein [Actinotalea fermentans]KGM15082.1 hypothetical protein N867_12180 [Actinotalea fermentans ATCC 43279 = JCM 9966 = DSM 3133]GEN80097.1 hypothetical protein AFE02nite_18310 [Actinotalea fermentans]
MNDLTLALWKAADHATAGREPLPASPVLTRIRRRRTVRYASQGAVGVAAAGAAVVGGVQVASRAPEPTPAATDLADAMTIRCGASIDEFAQPDGAPDVTFNLDASIAMVEPADAEIPFFAFAEATPEVAEQTGSTLTFALVDDGVVVGLPADRWTGGETPGFDEQTDPRQLTAWTDVPFAACQADGSLAGSPAPGTYAVVAYLLPDGPTDWPIPFRSTTVVLHLGDTVDEAGRRPELDSLVVSSEGLGPIQLGGAPPAQAPGAMFEVCVNPSDTSTTTSAWVSTYPFTPGIYGTYTKSIAVRTDGGVVTRLEVVAPGPRTTAGIQVGDTLADLQAAHPDVQLIGHVEHSGSIPGRDVWALVGNDRLLAFEVTTDEPAGAPQFDIGPGTVAAIVAELGTTYQGEEAAIGMGCDS